MWRTFWRFLTNIDSINNSKDSINSNDNGNSIKNNVNHNKDDDNDINKSCIKAMPLTQTAMEVNFDILFFNTTEDKEQDKRQAFISDDTFLFLMFINSGVITLAISIVGLGTNVANIATFVRLGFQDTINISLTALAATDLASLVCLVWMSICYVPAFCDLVCDVIDLHQVVYILGGMQRAYFTIVAGCITTVVACERCLCVLMPLQVKVLLTRNKLAVVLLGVFLLASVPFLPLLYTTGLGWSIHPATNGSILTINYSNHLLQLDFVCFGLMVALCVATYCVVTLCTIVIVWKLASQSAWRAGRGKESSTGSEIDSNAAPSSKKSGVSGRDKRATITVTLIATMYIVCFFPGAVIMMTMALVPDFNKGMFYGNIYELLWSLAYIVEAICSSANIVVYIKTSTKFKEAFMSFFIASDTNNFK